MDKETLKKWATKNILLCPACGKPYEYCHGKFKVPYFRHKEKEECDDKYSEPETEEHIKGKVALYDWIKKQDGIYDVILEGWVSETHQRPDIMFKYKNEQFVIEYQCSPIASEYVERHELYKAAGINDIWVLGTEKYINKSETDSNFKRKVIESYANYYLDSNYNIFLSSLFFNLTGSDYLVMKTDNYYYMDRRNCIDRECVTFDNNTQKYMTDINSLFFSMSGFSVLPKIEESVEKQSKKLVEENKSKELFDKNVTIFIDKIINIFWEEYHTEISHMRYNYSFKCNLHYYRFVDINNYPLVSFSRIEYSQGFPVFSHIFYIDLNNEDDIKKVVNFLREDLRDFINNNLEIHNFILDEERKQKEKLDSIKFTLSQYKKRIYLLFIEDNIKVNNDIRFILVKNYYEDSILMGKELISIFDFLDSKNADKYVLMIPTKKLRNGNSVNYPLYKVRNYKNGVLRDFDELGLKYYGYEELMRCK